MAYGFTIFLAIITCIFLAEHLIKQQKLNIEIFWKTVFWVIVSGIIGARIYHVIDLWELYSHFPLSALFVWNGGLGIFGAIIAGALCAVLMLLRQKEKLFDWLDTFFVVL